MRAKQLNLKSTKLFKMFLSMQNDFNYFLPCLSNCCLLNKMCVALNVWISITKMTWTEKELWENCCNEFLTYSNPIKIKFEGKDTLRNSHIPNLSNYIYIQPCPSLLLPWLAMFTPSRSVDLMIMHKYDTTTESCYGYFVHEYKKIQQSRGSLTYSLWGKGLDGNTQ